MKKKLETINVNTESFNRIKKNKPTIYVEEKSDMLENLRKNDKVILKAEEKSKKLVRKIKTIYQAQNYKELTDMLGKKSKIINHKNTQSENLIGIEFKINRRIIKKILLGLLILVIAVFSYFFLSNFIMKHNNDKLQENIKEVSSEITYVIIEINPKAILELKDGIVVNIGCLNEDCLNIFKDINLENSTLKEATEKLYNKAKENNIDVSNGVLLSSDNHIEEEVKQMDYVQYKQVDKQQIKEEIKKVINNEDIKTEKNENKINNDILSVYKKDKGYGNLYKCEIIDSKPTCYITKSFAKKLSSKNETIEEFMEALNDMRKLENILDKFEFDYEQGGVEGLKQMIVNRVAVSGTSYPLFYGITYVEATVSANPDDVLPAEKHSEYYDFGLTVYDSNWYSDSTAEIKYVVLPIEKIELISRTYKEEDLVTITEENGYLKISKNS